MPKWIMSNLAGGRIASRAIGFAASVFGPATSAVANLCLALLLVRTTAPADYGIFSFGQVLLQLGIGLSNALFCTPLAVILNSKDHEPTEIAAINATQVIFAICAAVAIGGFLVLLGGNLAVGFVFGFASAAGLLRWFWRARAIAEHKRSSAILSDVTFAVLLLGGLGLANRFGHLHLIAAGELLTGCAALSLWPFGRMLSPSPGAVGWRALRAYGRVWARQSSWATVGVASTELTANAHSYVVTSIAGTAAFAPIALAGLIWRPMLLVISSLTQFERPALVAAIAEGAHIRATRILRSFVEGLGVSLILNAIVAALVLGFSFEPMSHGKYELRDVACAAALLGVVMLIRVVREPLGVLAQAHGQFRHLAVASLLASPISLISCVSLAIALGPVSSVAGLVVGEMAMTAALFILTRDVHSELVRQAGRAAVRSEA